MDISCLRNGSKGGCKKAINKLWWRASLVDSSWWFWFMKSLRGHKLISPLLSPHSFCSSKYYIQSLNQFLLLLFVLIFSFIKLSNHPTIWKMETRKIISKTIALLLRVFLGNCFPSVFLLYIFVHIFHHNVHVILSSTFFT